MWWYSQDVRKIDVMVFTRRQDNWCDGIHKASGQFMWWYSQGVRTIHVMVFTRRQDNSCDGIHKMSFTLILRSLAETSVLLRCYFAFVLPILEYYSPVWGSAAGCHLQLFERQVCSVARLCPNRTFLSLCHRRHVAALGMLYKVNSNSNHCLFSELPSSSVRVWHSCAADAAHPLEFEVSRCKKSQFARCFLSSQTRVLNDHPYPVFDTRTLDGFKEGVNRWLLPWVCFQFFLGVGTCGVA